MVRLFSCFWIISIAVAIVAVGLACSASSVAEAPADETAATKTVCSTVSKIESVTVFLTGNELSSLQPCGCASGQLGGLDRRAAVLTTVPPGKRVIVNTGNLVENDSGQDLIKFSIIVQAFSMLDYDVVNFTDKDVEIAESLGILTGNSFVSISSFGEGDGSLVRKFTKQLPLDKDTINVTVGTFDTKTGRTEEINELFEPSSAGQTANILIINTCEEKIISEIGRIDAVDVVVCPGDADEAIVLSESGSRPLVVSVGRFGEYVGKLEISTDKSGAGLKFEYTGIPVEESLPQEKMLVDLYKVYQGMVKSANLLESYPRFSLPEGLEYVGSKTCKICHDYEYSKWSTKAHSHAYATLEKVGSQYDPECAICHTVGMRYEQGFISEATTADMKDVGCENCHGPGSEHLKTLGKVKTTEPKQQCIECHTSERSANYAGNEAEYFKNIVHWREPNRVADVK